VSRIVNWGHWVVAMLSGFLGLYCFATFVVALVILRHLWPPARHDQSSFVLVSMNFVAWLPLLLCAWGILRLKAWGYMLAITISGCAILMKLEELVFVGFSRIRASEISTLTGACLVAAWLLLPPVRAAYWHKEKAA
jgi:hypothetical protein